MKRIQIERNSKERKSNERKSEEMCMKVTCLSVLCFRTIVTKHQIPIGQMGNYQEHLKRINPLREVDSGSVKTQLFGNPFKLEKASDKVRFRCMAAA